MTATATLPTIVVAPEVQSCLCQLAFQIFTAKPGEGETRTGSLLGRCGPNGPEITGFSDAIEPYAVGQWSLHRRLPKRSTAPGLHIAVAPITATRAAASPNTARSARASDTSPMRVEVAWAFT